MYLTGLLLLWVVRYILQDALRHCERVGTFYKMLVIVARSFNLIQKNSYVFISKSLFISFKKKKKEVLINVRLLSFLFKVKENLTISDEMLR